MFNGHRTTEHEEDYWNCRFIQVYKNQKMVQLLLLKNNSFLKSYFLFYFPANILSFSSKKCYFVYSFSHIYHLTPVMVWMNELRQCGQFYQLTGFAILTCDWLPTYKKSTSPLP